MDDKILEVLLTSMMRLWSFISMVRIFQRKAPLLLSVRVAIYGVLPNVARFFIQEQGCSAIARLCMCILAFTNGY